MEEIDSVLIEADSETATSFLEADLFDKVSFFIAPVIVGDHEAIAVVGGNGVNKVIEAIRLKDVEVNRIGEDLIITDKGGRYP